METSTPTYAWYALKVFFNKVFEFEELFTSRGYETYFPTQKVEVKGDKYLRFRHEMALNPGQPMDPKYVFEEPYLYQRVPVINSLLFLRCPKADIKRARNLLGERGFIYLSADQQHFAVIPDRQMELFRLVAESQVKDLEYFGEDPFTRYKQGDKVRVIDGPLKGAEGYIKRIKKNRRLLVSIEGVIAVATSYIPPELLEKVTEPAAEA